MDRDPQYDAQMANVVRQKMASMSFEFAETEIAVAIHNWLQSFSVDPADHLPSKFQSAEIGGSPSKE